jgi:thiosulfate dehydrogenase (quinone) large subunit
LTPLPSFGVNAFARITPPVELAIGLLVLFGAASRFGLALGGLWMVVLIFGSALIEKYDAVGFSLFMRRSFFNCYSTWNKIHCR